MTADIGRRMMEGMLHPNGHIELVSPQLRNALVPLVNYVELLKLQGSDPQTIALIFRQIDRLQCLMDKLLLGKSDDSASTPE